MIAIHLKSRNGLYRLIKYNTRYMILKTNDYQFKRPIDDFKCLAGGNWNKDVHPNDIKRFMWFLEKSKERTKIFQQMYDFYFKY